MRPRLVVLRREGGHLFGPTAVVPYRWLWVAAVMIGSVVSLPVVRDFADIANLLMAVPNLLALIALNRVLVDETRAHLWERGRS